MGRPHPRAGDAGAVRRRELTDPAEVADECARRLAAVDGVAAVVLGGSRALGVADHWSDVDLGIFYDPARPPALSELRAVARELDDRHPDDAVTGFGEWDSRA